MKCKKNCDCKDCSCKNGAMTTNPCPPATPCVGCAQIHDANCIIYTGDDIESSGINTGDRLNSIIDKLSNQQTTQQPCDCPEPIVNEFIKIGTVTPEDINNLTGSDDIITYNAAKQQGKIAEKIWLKVLEPFESSTTRVTAFSEIPNNPLSTEGKYSMVVIDCKNATRDIIVNFRFTELIGQVIGGQLVYDNKANEQDFYAGLAEIWLELSNTPTF
jgi:hypothetical protein